MNHCSLPASAFLIASFVVSLPGPTVGEPSEHERLDKLVSKASDLRHARKYRESTTFCEGVIGDKTATPKHVRDAFSILFDVHRRQRKYAEVLKAADRMLKALPNDPEGQTQALLAQADALRDSGKYDDAIAKAREIVEKHPESKAACMSAHLKASYLLLRARKYEEAYQEAQKCTEADPENHKLVTEGLWHMKDAALRMGDSEKCLAAIERLREPKHFEYLGRRDQYLYRERGDCFVRLERPSEATAHYEQLAKEHADLRFRQECLLRAASVYTTTEKFDTALKTCERVILEFPTQDDRWYSAQRQIVETLKRQEKYVEAVKAARLCLDGAWDHRILADNVRLIAELLKTIDTHVARANQLIRYQSSGPAGIDGKPGTADDLRDPLQGFPRPKYPEREKVFAEARKNAGDDAKSSRYRAMTWLYTGYPRKALECYLDAFGRAGARDWEKLGKSLVLVGARAAQGHPAGLYRFFNYVNYGPNGPDGKPKTPDDLKDPFAALLNGQ